jgi:hypothetical protein
MPGLTTGPISALSLSPPRLEVAGRSFAVPEAALLRGLEIGDRVTVAWEEAGGRPPGRAHHGEVDLGAGRRDSARGAGSSTPPVGQP